jgi:hypothetical protein
MNYEPVKEIERDGGKQWLYRFENGYGASVIRNVYSYGTELAVIVWDGEEWELTYETPVTNDVLGYLNPDTLLQALIKIAGLPKR